MLIKIGGEVGGGGLAASLLTDRAVRLEDVASPVEILTAGGEVFKLRVAEGGVVVQYGAREVWCRRGRVTLVELGPEQVAPEPSAGDVRGA
jgi:hypothetical protein